MKSQEFVTESRICPINENKKQSQTGRRSPDLNPNSAKEFIITNNIKLYHKRTFILSIYRKLPENWIYSECTNSSIWIIMMGGIGRYQTASNSHRQLILDHQKNKFLMAVNVCCFSAQYCPPAKTFG